MHTKLISETASSMYDIFDNRQHLYVWEIYKVLLLVGIKIFLMLILATYIF